jgi:hypothetical protein
MRTGGNGEVGPITVGLMAVTARPGGSMSAQAPALRPVQCTGLRGFEGQVAANDVEDGVMQPAVGREDAGLDQRERFAAAGADAAASFFHEQSAGGEIPGEQLEFEVGAEQPEPDHAQVWASLL